MTLSGEVISKHDVARVFFEMIVRCLAGIRLCVLTEYKWYTIVAMSKETLNKWLRGRSAAWRGTRFLAYRFDMSQSPRSMRLASRTARTLFQRFPQ